MVCEGYRVFSCSSTGNPCSNSPREAVCIQITGLFTVLNASESLRKICFLPCIHSLAFGLAMDAILMALGYNHMKNL